MTSKAQEYLSTAVQLSATNITEAERSKIHDKLHTIKQSVDSADWDALIKCSNNPTIRAELRKLKTLCASFR